MDIDIGDIHSMEFFDDVIGFDFDGDGEGMCGLVELFDEIWICEDIFGV